MKRPFLIQTQRLELRELAEEDLEAVQAFSSDPRVVEHSPWGPNTLDETRAWLEDALRAQHESPRSIYELAIARRSDRNAIGTCHLGILDRVNREARLGYTLRFEVWGQGIATEAAGALLAFAFDELGLHRVYATASPLNVASHRVLEKIGMSREGLLKSHVLMRGRWRDSVLYAAINSREAGPLPG